MGRDIRDKFDVHSGQDSPLSYAVRKRDGEILEIVAKALKTGRVKLAYQGVVPARDTGRPAFYEGLVRVVDETGRVIPAQDFIAAVETTETGRQVDCASLRLGLDTLNRYPDLRLAINMSARSIGYEPWITTLEDGLNADPTVAHRLILEITEGSAILVPELVLDFMNRMQRQGVSFALDDFGSGFTSFRYLKQFFFDILKIDGQFIRGIAHSPDNQILTKAMAGIAEQLDLVCIAESVETAEDALFLQKMGMDCLQGYFFGAPTVEPPWERLEQHHASG
ncbi:MAG: EAL domain-containing protein [Roseovarius sp.]